MKAVPTTRVLAADAEAVETAARCLAAGGLVAFPTETVYGLGADATNGAAVARLYAAPGAPCLPVALNSGLVWPRRSFLRHPGVVRVEILDPIPPGLAPEALFARLQHDIETATARLLAEGEA